MTDDDSDLSLIITLYYIILLFQFYNNSKNYNSDNNYAYIPKSVIFFIKVMDIEVMLRRNSAVKYLERF